MKTSETSLIPLEDINLNPDNANHMDRSVFEKIKASIKETGRYPVATVNRRADGTLWMVDGEHRLKILKELDRPTIECKIWEVSEADELLFLHNLNNLRGKDVYEKRQALLEKISIKFEKKDLIKKLPLKKKAVEDLYEKKKKLLETPTEDIGQAPDIFWDQRLRPAEYGELMAFLKDNFENEDPKRIIMLLVKILKGMGDDHKRSIREAKTILVEQEKRIGEMAV